MTDVETLKQRIKDRGLKLNFIADQLGIKYQSLYNKLEGSSDFTILEMTKLTKLLGLSAKEQKSIFFNESVN